jgi:DnaJ-class molecular chaperone
MVDINVLVECPICGGLGFFMGLPCIGCGGDGKSRFSLYHTDRMTLIKKDD